MAVAVAARTEYEALPGRVVFGAGALAQLPVEVDRLGARWALVIEGPLALAADVGAGASLAELGLDAAEGDRAAQETRRQRSCGPVPVTSAEVRALLDRAMAGAGTAVKSRRRLEEKDG